ncbi:hypothetical protein FN846DRAFT_209065 [Sphaerosporella brunnea]|uniref:Protein kinase domain-containing protein n=1 Tax=Sphaerosporella brunnea TaxID=1250544 RepID=A0A5J5EP24_9PEZI|nr:hypothetical protein FN846DRAFT_209065 [Sphaerosporella brunnea]
MPSAKRQRNTSTDAPATPAKRRCLANPGVPPNASRSRKRARENDEASAITAGLDAKRPRRTARNEAAPTRRSERLRLRALPLPIPASQGSPAPTLPAPPRQRCRVPKASRPSSKPRFSSVSPAVSDLPAAPAAPSVSAASSLPSSSSPPPCSSPPSSPPPDTAPDPRSVPPIVPRAAPTRYAHLPPLSDFTCTFERELHSSPAGAVLLVSLPDSSLRLLKIYAPAPDGQRDIFNAEYTAYTALLHHGVCLPPTAPGKRFVPYCYGGLALRHLRRNLQRAAAWKSPLKKLLPRTPLLALVLEYIPNSTTVAADPAQLLRHPHLVDELLEGIDKVHAAGVMHEDPLPRNMVIQSGETPAAWWVDFGSALTDSCWHIDPRYFEGELCRVKDDLLEDVIPSEREGRTPEWCIMGL